VTSTVPIVFVSGGDPAELGLVASLARSGGNLTGVSILAAELTPKRLELLSELQAISVLGHPRICRREISAAAVTARRPSSAGLGAWDRLDQRRGLSPTDRRMSSKLR
jgi:hypothetical protein